MGTRGKRGAAPSKPLPKSGMDTGRRLIEIELALAEEFSWKRNIIAFNVNGLSGKLAIFHECDMLVLTRAGYLTEIEIKRSFADFCNEFKKSHHHESLDPDIKEFWYCIPEGILEKVQEKLSREKWLPSGIITYDEDLTLRFKGPPDIEGAVRLFSEHPRPLSPEQQLELARLGAMRQVTLRKKILSLEKKASRPNQRYENRIQELETILREYRERFKQETGYKIDEREILFG